MALRVLLGALPLAIFLAAAAFFLWGLNPQRDPSEIPSMLIGKEAPAFELGPIPGADRPGLATADLKGHGVTLVNIFASWCIPCRAEHGVLSKLAGDGVRLVGIDYKDKPADVLKYLGELGNPYERLGADTAGRAGIDWGISGVPETFVVDDKGRVVYRHVGPIAPNQVDDEILPALEQAAK
ncbi:cytochrome c biogenesis protein CcmG, thiol:disulfide interchange protein DsbE [Tistlia consotensis]|uniref:Cytochrome c biogenesis protein CcmG, thiol:disulfide interchange protein DsbE n=1 Tax=Tistlia consotensis USBA 355 TaxID=560819 RepID=A0A1Y6BJZ8_9PROT|nr:DsbE family thiol:disulfide interchange protein [Tistlia consotensis]SMF11826.1 cytochrome c biogenesis protein CcmG, thiol:disulfide interchange protein DsbE [Tistlia consotensis USBA 355]SNR51634.1 cytochrome c biogenesis protein CcmG, thiol:disulfide interchange protein DsbE [Tistlia consotensis]